MAELEKNDLWTILFISYCASLIKDLPAEDISYQKISELMAKDFKDDEIKELIAKNIAEMGAQHSLECGCMFMD